MEYISQVFSHKELNVIEEQLQFHLAREKLWFYVDSVWEKQLIEGFWPNSIRVSNLSSGFLNYVIFRSVFRHFPYINDEKVRVFGQFCQFFNGSGINSHYDSKWSWAGTIYLNREWDRLNGGWFCCRDFTHVPKYNSMVLNIGQEEHSVSRVYNSVQPRTTIQLWAIS